MNEKTKAADEAPACAGWSMNPNAPIEQRLACGKQALDFYIEQADRLEALLDYLTNGMEETKNDDYELMYARPVYDDVINRLQNILNGHEADAPELQS